MQFVLLEWNNALRLMRLRIAMLTYIFTRNKMCLLHLPS